jgi:phospholipid N-methyltransferase
MSADARMSRSRLRELGLFARNFVKHPRMLGSVIPSSRFLIERLLKGVDWERAKVVVEYGPGVGTFTREILRRLAPDATLVVLETNPEFVRFLRDTVRDPRLHVVHDSAAEVGRALRERGLGAADYVISGIPFSTLPAEVREAVLGATRAALHPRGAFLVYQFSSRVLPDLRRIFSGVRRSYEPRNVLPAHLFFCAP